MKASKLLYGRKGIHMWSSYLYKNFTNAFESRSASDNVGDIYGCWRNLFFRAVRRILAVSVKSVNVKSFLFHEAARLDESPRTSGAPSVQNTKVFFPKFYLAKNIFIISKMFTAFVVSKRTYKIRILPWWHQPAHRKQKEGAGDIERSSGETHLTQTVFQAGQMWDALSILLTPYFNSH